MSCLPLKHKKLLSFQKCVYIVLIISRRIVKTLNAKRSGTKAITFSICIEQDQPVHP
jgi:hypothetical protein